jgi:5'(3')-deoxyribonucleotidase
MIKKFKIKEDLFFDMDGVLANFHGKINMLLTPTDISHNKNILIEGHPDREPFVEALEKIPGFYRDLVPIDGAIDAFKRLSKHYNTFILSTASWDNPSCFTDKRLWVEEHLGELAYKRLILTHHKEHFTGRALIDDRTKNGAEDFNGEHIHFATKIFPNWDSVLKYLL